MIETVGYVMSCQLVAGLDIPRGFLLQQQCSIDQYQNPKCDSALDGPVELRIPSQPLGPRHVVVERGTCSNVKRDPRMALCFHSYCLYENLAA